MLARVPICIVVDLPPPLSLNLIWAYSRKGVRPSARYERWKVQADKMATLQHIFRGLHTIKGRFAAGLMVSDKLRLDLDNALKAPMDWAQSRGLIANDRNCWKVSITRMPAKAVPSGAQLTLVEMP